MGDWESTWGMHDSGASIGTSPCWNDEWEQKLLAQGYRPVEEWNEVGHVVKKGENGTFLSCAQVFVFKESQTRYSSAFVRHMKEVARLDAERDLRISQCAAKKTFGISIALLPRLNGPSGTLAEPFPGALPAALSSTETRMSTVVGKAAPTRKTSECLTPRGANNSFKPTPLRGAA